ELKKLASDMKDTAMRAMKHEAEKRVDRMEQKMRSGLALRAERPGLALGGVDYGPDGQIAYDLGAWAIAWLCHRAGPDVLIERFYPAVEALGWEAAFEEAFGLAPAAFYAEFDRFLELDRERQRAEARRGEATTLHHRAARWPTALLRG
ncbi:MAG: hypothetical protein ACPGPE_06705, partial [Planctomycetota bacterium]